MRMVDPEVLRLGTTYMHIILAGISTMFVSMTLGSIFRAGGDTITPMVVLIFATLINIVLDPLLIFRFMGIPETRRRRFGVCDAHRARGERNDPTLSLLEWTRPCLISERSVSGGSGGNA